MIEKILPKVYDITCLEDNGRYRAYLFTEPTPTPVDTGLSSATEELFDGIERVGVEPERVATTHDDDNHIGGLDNIVERFDIETWAPEQRALDVPLHPNHVYADGQKTATFVGIHVPDHGGENHALIDEDAGVAVLGDVLVGADQRRLPAGYLHFPQEFHSEELNAAEDNRRPLIQSELDIGLVFHSSSVTTEARDRIDAYIHSLR